VIRRNMTGLGHKVERGEREAWDIRQSTTERTLCLARRLFLVVVSRVVVVILDLALGSGELGSGFWVLGSEF
jgi:hypothetical protein